MFKTPLTSGFKRNLRSVVVPGEAQCAGYPGTESEKASVVRPLMVRLQMRSSRVHHYHTNANFLRDYTSL